MDFERGWCSHVDAVLDSGELLGAHLDGGVAIRAPNYETWARVKRLALPATETQAQDFYGFMRSQIGKPYDSWAIAGLVIGRDWRSPDSWYCSEATARGLEVSKWFPAPLSDGVEFITPRDQELIVSPWAQLVFDTGAAVAA